MRQEEIGHVRDKAILDPNSAHTRPGEQIPKKKIRKIQKINKTTFRRYFQPKRDEIGRESDNRILDPNSAHTRPGRANSEKKSRKNSKN